MIFSILMMLLLLFSVACVLFFIFYLLLPSLNAQHVNMSNPLFSEQEFLLFSAAKPDSVSKRAVILCSVNHGRSMEANSKGYRGFMDCSFYDAQFETEGDCKYGCIGLGSCRKACPRGAISIVDGTAVVNIFCDGCGKCIPKCPRALIKLVDASYSQEVSCDAYTRFNGSYEDKCGQFDSRIDLSPEKILKPRSYAVWHRLAALLHRV